MQLKEAIDYTWQSTIVAFCKLMKLGLYVCQREDTSLRTNRQTLQIMDNSFYSGAMNTGYLNLGFLVGNAMQTVGLH